MQKPVMTPGSWVANVDTVWTSRSTHLITCFPIHDEQSRGNARAIAALPDLLAALEAVYAYTMANPDNRDLQPLHLQTVAGLTKAGYTF